MHAQMPGGARDPSPRRRHRYAGCRAPAVLVPPFLCAWRTAAIPRRPVPKMTAPTPPLCTTSRINHPLSCIAAAAPTPPDPSALLLLPENAPAAPLWGCTQPCHIRPPTNPCSSHPPPVSPIACSSSSAETPIDKPPPGSASCGLESTGDRQVSWGPPACVCPDTVAATGSRPRPHVSLLTTNKAIHSQAVGATVTPAAQAHVPSRRMIRSDRQVGKGHGVLIQAFNL